MIKNKKEGRFLTLFLPYFLLGVALIFNFYSLYPELSVKADPNDNVFQFALVQRMNEIWEKGGSLLDHWVPTWASGYPLPYYYQHLPHLFIVFIYHFLFKTISLYNIFNLVKFLFWVFLPLSFYFSNRMFGFSKLTSALTAFFGSQILTDGLYGADISSFSWRGYGLSTQLFALFFAPLALSQIYQCLKLNKRSNKTARKYLLAILFLSATFASHLAFGYIIVLSALFIPLALAKFSRNSITHQFKNLLKLYFKLFLLLTICFLLLSYWFVPLFLANTYHNISFWDSPLKWNSYGFKEAITMFLDGALFDFSRIPILTFLTVVGFLFSLYRFKNKYRLFALLFPFWFVLYFGRTTWGFLIDLLPMMREMHLQRLLNGLHLVSFPLMGVGAAFLLRRLKKPFLALVLVVLFAIPVYKANASYLNLNKIWIKQANLAYQDSAADFEKLVAKIKELLPGRVYAGTPGGWGREFKIGSTQMYLALSTAGVQINGFLPESWSLNSEPEPFFNMNRFDDYQLFNVRFLVTPKDYPVPEFLKPVAEFGRFKLSQAPTTGYFDVGTSNLLVKTEKENFANIVHLWLLSNLPGKKEFPTLSLTSNSPKLNYPSELKLDNDYLTQNLAYTNLPRPNWLGKIKEEKIENEKYQAKIEVNQDCLNCLVIFKMTYHPNWQVKIDNQPSYKFMVFPSYIAANISPGMHQVTMEYKASTIKTPLLILGLFGLITPFFIY